MPIVPHNSALNVTRNDTALSVQN